MWRGLLLVVACGGTQGVEPGNPPPERDHVEASACADAEAPTPPPSAPTEAEVLACDEFERSEDREPPARSARVVRMLLAARAAQRDDRLEAVEKLEAVHRLAPGDSGILGELGWARLAASHWCDDNIDPDVLSASSERCEPMTRDAAVDELSRALDGASTHAQRGALHYNLGRAFERDMPEEAEAAYRASLCLRPNDTVRGALGEILARRARGEPIGEAILTLHAAVLFDAASRPALDAALQRWNAEFAWTALDVAEDMHASVDGLCTQTRSPDECHLIGEWVESEGRALGHVVMADPDDDTSMAHWHVLVARTSRGISVVGELGTESGDSRDFNAYVGNVEIEPATELPFAVVTWVSGSASAAGCGWEAEATSQMLLCAHEREGARCFAGATLGPAEFESPNMLPTAQESLGNCDDDPGELVSNPSAALFEVSFDADEIIVRRDHDGRTWCQPLVETLCATAISSARSPRFCSR